MNRYSGNKALTVIFCIVMLTSTMLMVNGCKKGEDGIKVGVNISQTGPLAYWGTQLKRGIEVAAEETNATSKNEKVNVIFEDNQGQTKNAITIAQKLATVDKVAAIVTAHTFIAKPQQPLADQYKTPLIGTVIAGVGFGKVNTWSFLDFPSHKELTPPVAEYAAKNLKVKTAAILVVNDDLGNDGAMLFKQGFESNGGAITGQETFAGTDKDVRSQLTKLLIKNPQILYTVGRDDSLVLVVKQARELGFKGFIAGINAFDSPLIWKGLGDLGEGIIFTGVVGHATSGTAVEFEAAYEKKFNEKSDWVSLYGYTIGKYLFPIVLQSKGDREKIREALSALKVSSARGDLEMTQDRNVLSKVNVYIRKGGKNVPALEATK